MRETVAFAYYVDNTFVGWYGDSFGSICDTPKIYGNSIQQLSTIQSNFNYKMQKINETSFEKELATITDGSHPVEIVKLFVFNGEKSLKGHKVELRMVACPIYDGPNPEFDRATYTKIQDDRRADMKSLGIFDFPPASMERMNAIEIYDKEHPVITKDSWIYANYDELKAWAAVEPTEFLKVLTPLLNT